MYSLTAILPFVLNNKITFRSEQPVIWTKYFICTEPKLPAQFRNCDKPNVNGIQNGLLVRSKKNIMGVVDSVIRLG